MTSEVAAFSTTETREPRYQPCILLLAAVAVGMTIDRYWPLSPTVWYLAASAAAIGWLLLWLRNTPAPATCLLLFAAAATGGAWHHNYWYLVPQDEIGLSVTEEIRPLACEGIAVTSPRWSPAPPLHAMRSVPKGDETELLVRVTSVRHGAKWQPASGYAMLDVDGHLLGVRAGDRIRMLVLSSQPMEPLNPGEFNYADYERSRRVFCRLRGLFPESVTVVERGSAWSWRLWLSWLRERGNGILREHISYNRSTLAAALLLGAREQLDPERNEGFLVTGTIHVLSISGLHVGILAYGFWLLFRTGLFPRQPMLWSAIIFICIYCVLTDSQPPIVRSTILVVTVCLATLFGRQALGFNTLAFAGLVVLAMNPASLFQAGPQLSFLSVAAMILFARWLTKPVVHDPLDQLIAASRSWPDRATRAIGGEVWRVWLTGAVVWTVTMPLVWLQYGLISPIALLLSIVVWIPITLAMYTGFAVLLFGPLVPTLGSWLGKICDGNLWLIEFCIAQGQRPWGNHVWYPPPPWWWVALFYIAFFAWAFLPQWKTKRFWACSLTAGWLAVALYLATFPLPNFFATEKPGLSCTFVAVGHGTSVLLETADGHRLLYDAGKLGSPVGAARPIAALLGSRGITHLDAIVISHADSDHFNAVPELLQRYSVGVIYVSPFMFEKLDQPAVRELKRVIDKANIPLREITSVDKLQLGDATAIEILHPTPRGVIGSDNAHSLVLLLKHAGHKVLLPGDLESPGLEDVLAELPIDCDIVMTPHHGSKRSDPRGFANWSRPEYAVISGGYDVEDIADINSVKLSYSQLGSAVFHTAETGSVRFNLGENRITVETFRQQPTE
ncbi:ComEC/Rec2 family competence protein [Anatilimnocola sp. NA78]|uniref:ComEC/Rec2 family competence protein n=1 Tax=Anatilimnocola sp. NA78 TaxID=3415683 RepID=UPI003CE5858B